MSIDYPAVIATESAALLAAAVTAAPDTPVPSCPGWDLDRLGAHLGRVMRWATVAMVQRTEPDIKALEKAAPGQGVEYLARGVDAAVAAATQIAPEDTCWTWAGAEPGGGFWPRRLAHEVAVHRWDAERAAGSARPNAETFDPALAADGVDEVLNVLAPVWVRGADEPVALGGTIHVHCTDTEGEWTIGIEDGAYACTLGHSKGTVALRGPASTLLLALWGRVTADEPGLDVFGERAVLDRWTAAFP